MDKQIELLEELKLVLECMFWKGEKDHPQMIEFRQSIDYAISALKAMQEAGYMLSEKKSCPNIVNKDSSPHNGMFRF